MLSRGIIRSHVKLYCHVTGSYCSVTLCQIMLTVMLHSVCNFWGEGCLRTFPIGDALILVPPEFGHLRIYVLPFQKLVTVQDMHNKGLEHKNYITLHLVALFWVILGSTRVVRIHFGVKWKSFPLETRSVVGWTNV